jgi:hypothetical protein
MLASDFLFISLSPFDTIRAYTAMPSAAPTVAAKLYPMASCACIQIVFMD